MPAWHASKAGIGEVKTEMDDTFPISSTMVGEQSIGSSSERGEHASVVTKC